MTRSLYQVPYFELTCMRPETRVATSRVSGRKETVSVLVFRKAKKLMWLGKASPACEQAPSEGGKKFS